MKDLFLFLAAIAISLIIFAPLHLIAIRGRSGSQLLTVINASIFFSSIVGAAITWWLFGADFSSFGAKLVACLGGAATFSGYAIIYALFGPVSIDRSVSVHIVKLLYLAPDRKMSEAKLLDLYAHSDLLGKRFSECIGAGIIERKGDDLTLTRHGSRIAMVYVFMAKLFGMRPWYLERREPDRESA